MRRFIHHPTEFPILISPEGSAHYDRATLCNIGEEGLACRLPHAIPPGAPVTLQIPSLHQEYSVSGRVVKCDRYTKGFGVSILFNDKNESFKSKMVEQVCQIEHYRQALLKDGRELDSETAAQEWIARYSHQFFKTFSE
ncbi:MAG: PilZ domain-containing protein [Gammaproteobacteria bacterium]|nr:MAG: PilZ domain-containing protein [Gammaproteobacteria bacterium]